MTWLRAHHPPKDYDSSAYFLEVQQEREAWLAQVRTRASLDHVPVTISRLIAEVRAFLDRDAIVLTSSGNRAGAVVPGGNGLRAEDEPDHGRV